MRDESVNSEEQETKGTLQVQEMEHRNWPRRTAEEAPAQGGASSPAELWRLAAPVSRARDGENRGSTNVLQ